MSANKVSCSKCGSENIITRYIAEGDVITHRIHPKWMDVAETEQLRRHCQECGYEWSTDTLEQMLFRLGQKMFNPVIRKIEHMGNDLLNDPLDTVAEHTKRIEALETRLATPTDPFGKFAEPDIDSVDYRKDDYQPKHDVTVRRNARPVSQPELIDGWWYKSPVCKIVDNGESSAYVRYTGIKADGSSFPIIGSTISSFSLATLDDLAHEVDGVKVWMVEESNSIVMYVGTSDSFMVRFYNRNSRDEQPIARYIATKCGWPIIPDAQMRSLRNESDRYNHRNV
jgi:predicted nucleic-acid-binding Zn-ribbon protein